MAIGQQNHFRRNHLKSKHYNMCKRAKQVEVIKTQERKLTYHHFEPIHREPKVTHKYCVLEGDFCAFC